MAQHVEKHTYYYTQITYPIVGKLVLVIDGDTDELVQVQYPISLTMNTRWKKIEEKDIKQVRSKKQIERKMLTRSQRVPFILLY